MGKSGHAILPYAIEEHINGKYIIWVYDSNWPPLYDSRPEMRAVFVDTKNNSWRYEKQEGEIWSHTNHRISLVPSSIYAQQPYSYSLVDVCNIFPVNNTNIFITNPKGESIGYISSELLNEIPNARAIPYMDIEATARDSSYELPTDVYTISLSGTQEETGGFSQIGEDYAIVFDNLNLTQQTEEKITTSSDGLQILYDAATPQNFNFISGFREADQTLGINISGFAINPNQPVSFETDINEHSFEISGISADGVYSLTFERFTSRTYEQFMDVAVPIAINDTQILEYGTDGDVKILIDHLSDDTIDETRTLELTESQKKSLFSVILDSPYFLYGGLGLLCLVVLAIGGVIGGRYFSKIKTTEKKRPISPLAPPQEAPSQSTHQIKHALSLAKSNQFQEAFDILREVVRAEPNNRSAWLYLGSVLVRMGDYENAEHCYMRAKKLGHPKADQALTWLNKKRQ